MARSASPFVVAGFGLLSLGELVVVVVRVCCAVVWCGSGWWVWLLGRRWACSSSLGRRYSSTLDCSADVGCGNSQSCEEMTKTNYDEGRGSLL